VVCKILRVRENAMTKANLIEEVSHLMSMTREDSEVIGEAIFERIVRSLCPGNKIQIRGFGSFGTRQHPPREIPNPKTGARVEVPSKQIPYFEPSKGLKKFVNHSSAPLAPPPRTRSRRPPKT
jgi:integration host factor subunit beta